MKKNNKSYLFVFGAWLCSLGALAQNDIAIGQWRTHFNYQQGYSLVKLNNRIFSNAFHSLLELDLENTAIKKHTKVNGLSDVGISAIAADENTNSLLVGYANGNIDIINESTTINLNDLLQANIIASKRINNIFVGESTFFATTDFGMLEIGLESFNIVNTYEELGRNGSVLSINDGGVKGDSIFLATSRGLIAGNFRTTNLLDFRNWKRSLELVGEIDFIEVSAEISYAGTVDGRLWVNKGLGWKEIILNIQPTFLKLQNNELLYGSGNRIFKRTMNDESSSYTLGVNTSVSDAFIDGETVWFADENNGLGQSGNQGVTYYTVDGPTERSIDNIAVIDDKLVTMQGGYEYNGLIPFNKLASASSFSSNGWENIDLSFLMAPKDAAAAISSDGSGNLYLLLYGTGIYHSAGPELIDDQTPGSLIQAANGFVPVTAMASNSDGDLIICSNQQSNKYMVLQASGRWEALDFIPSSVPAAVNLKQNAYGDFWGILPHSSNAGLIVFNLESRSYRLIGTSLGLPSTTIYDICFDRDDYALLATSGGLTIIINTYEVLNNVDLLITSPVAENSFVLNDELVQAVSVDGANRKWIGTDKGLYLLDEFGAGSLTVFTRETSPLPSNNVEQLAIDQNSGEVFVLTNAGLVSFRSSATVPKATMIQTKIFPNPVMPGYSGLVAIEGLAFDSVVKITNEAGRLVREMVSTGGTATWNLADYNGARVNAGIYIVFVSTRDGAQAVVGKIAVIN